jgi:hypothetical protein
MTYKECKDKFLAKDVTWTEKGKKIRGRASVSNLDSHAQMYNPNYATQSGYTEVIVNNCRGTSNISFTRAQT